MSSIISDVICVSTNKIPELQIEEEKNNEEQNLEETPFHNPQFLSELKSEPVPTLNDQFKLISSPVLPPCSSKQTDKLVDLIDSPFDLFDNEENEQPVLKNLSIRKILLLIFNTPAFKSSQILLQMRMAGGAVKDILESDLEWIKRLISSIANKDLSRFICPFPARRLPDIDIHLVCKDKSKKFRTTILSQLLNALGDQLICENNNYLHRQIEKIAALDPNEAEGDKEKAFIINAKYFLTLDDTKKENYLGYLASNIIQRFCLKKFSDNAFGSIIALGNLELVLTEKPGYLLTPDKLGVAFNVGIQKGQDQALTFTANDNAYVAEAIIHRISKIACIDQYPSEHTFIKACIYTTFGYLVPLNENFDLAISKFIRHIYSHSTNSFTEDGIEFLQRYEKYHFQINPNEGFCTLLHLFRFLENSDDRHIIPFIIKALDRFFNIPLNHPVLEVLRQKLIKFPNHYSAIEKCLRQLPSFKLIKELNEYRLVFEENGTVCPYLLSLSNQDSTAFSTLEDEDIEIATEILLDLLEKDTSFIENPQIAIDCLCDKNLRNYAYLLLLKGDKQKCSSLLLKNFPTVYTTFPLRLRPQLHNKMKSYFNDPQMNEILDRFGADPKIAKKQEAKNLWMLLLASSSIYCRYGVEIWESLKKAEVSLDIEMATAVLPHQSESAFRVIHKKLLEVTDSNISPLRLSALKVFQALLDKNSSTLTKELSNTAPELFIWLLNGILDRKDFAAKLISDTNLCFDIFKTLRKSDINFWDLITFDQSKQQLDLLLSENNISKVIAGLSSLQSKFSQCSVTQLTQLLEIISKALQKSATSDASKITLYEIAYSIFKNVKSTDEELKILLPLIIRIGTHCLEDHRKAKTIIFLSPLRTLTEILFTYTVDSYLANGVPKEQITFFFTSVLKDPSFFLAYLQKEATIFLDGLLPHIKNNELDIDRLLKAINESGLSFSGSKKLSEIRSLHELKNLDPHTSIDAQMKVLFDPKKRPADVVSYEKELMKFFKSLVEDNKFVKIPTFIAFVRAYKSDFDLKPIASALFLKLENLKKSRMALNKWMNLSWEILDIIISYDLDLYENEHESKIINFYSAVKEQNKVSECWEKLFKIYSKAGILLRKALLPILIQHPSKKHLEVLYDLFSKQIINDSFPELDESQIGPLIIQFIKMLGKFKSDFIIDLLPHRDKIKQRLTSDQYNELYEQWIYYIIDIYPDPDSIPDQHDELIFETFDVEGKLPFEACHRVSWKVFYYLANSQNIACVLNAWIRIYKFRSNYELVPELYNQAINTLLKNYEILETCFDLTEEERDLMYGLSDMYLDAYSSSSKRSENVREKLKEVQPLVWMKFLYYTHFHSGIDWILIYLKFSEVTPVGLQTCICIFENFIKKRSFENSQLKIIANAFFEFCIKVADFKNYKFPGLSILNSKILSLLLENFRIYTTIESGKLLVKACTILKRTTQNNIKLSFDESNYSKSLIKLSETKDLQLVVSIWNHLFQICMSVKKIDMQIYYQASSARSSETQLKFADLTDPDSERRKAYTNLLHKIVKNIYLRLLKRKSSDEVKLFLFDMAFNCMHQLLIEHTKTKYKQSPKAIFQSFRYFVDLVGKKDGIAFKTHCFTTVPLLATLLYTAKIGFLESEFYYEILTMTGFNPALQVLPFEGNLDKFAIQKAKTKTHVDKIFSEKMPLDESVFANVYQIILLGNAVKYDFILNHTQLIKYIKAIVEYLKTPIIANASPKELEDISGTPILALKDIPFSLKNLCSQSDNPAEALKECYTVLMESYLEILSLNNRSLIPDITWVEHYKSTCTSGFSDEYVKLMNRYLSILNVILYNICNEMKNAPPAISFKTILPILNKFLEFLNFKELSPIDSDRRVLFIRNLHDQITNMKLPISSIILIHSQKILNLK